MSFIQDIHSIQNIEYHPQEDLTSYSTMRLKSVGDLVIVKSVSALQALLPVLKKHHCDYLVVGWGANQLLPSRCHKIILHLSFPFNLDYFNEVRTSYILPASLGINYLTSHAIKFGLKGWEVFTGIPASLGGAIFMNAGTNLGEIGSLIKKVKLVTPEGELREELISSSSFSYRKNNFVQPREVIVEAELVHLGQDMSIPQKITDYLDYRKRTQPLTTKNCGCVFKNPMKDFHAGRLIDLLGLKGLSSGGLKVSEKHANFMENSGEATWENFQELVSAIKFQMDHFYGIEFELEVKIPYH